MIARLGLLLALAASGSGWERVESEACRFALDFPEVEVTTSLLADGVTEMRTYSVLRGRDTFSIACAPLAEPFRGSTDQESRLDRAAAQAIEGASIERVTADGYSARRTVQTFDLGDASLVVQHVHLFTETHMLSLGLADFDATDAEVERFFGSLDVLDE